MEHKRIEKAWLAFITAMQEQGANVSHVIIDTPLYHSKDSAVVSTRPYNGFEDRIKTFYGVEVIYAPR